MGLELGPPWLVLAMTSADSAGAEILLRDNFTGASLRRLISAKKSEPGSFAAVMDKNGRFARNGDGSIYDPIQQTKGRNGGTDADRGHRAFLTAQALFKVMDGLPSEVAFARPSSVGEVTTKWLGIAIAGILLLAVLGSLAN